MGEASGGVGSKGMICGKLGADVTVGEDLASDEQVHGASR
jgi:hypothetical protein